VSGHITRAPYNPGMNPFASLPDVRFAGEAKLGDPGVAYEFNVRVRCDSDAREADWAHEVAHARDLFAYRIELAYPYLRVGGFRGRSGGWLAIDDPEGRMTLATLRTLVDHVSAALGAFVERMERVYPRGGRS
jgi:hypothetical protein